MPTTARAVSEIVSYWGDQLTKYNGMTITYDDIGNPVSVGEDTYVWEGRKLLSLYDDYEFSNYTYNTDGIRTSKEYGEYDYNGYRHEYTLNGSQIVKETVYYNEYGDSGFVEDYTLVYIYDETGAPIGMKYRTPNMAKEVYEVFFFEKNLQGDIVSVYNSSGVKLIAYTYDAWGNFTQTYVGGTQAQIFTAQKNPFRYRGYYYDADTGLYYLQSRYYNPTWGRFIQSADISNLNPYSINGLNLYSYANNNPIGIAYSSSSVDGSISGGMVSSTALSGTIVSSCVTSNKGFSWPNLDFLGTGFGYIENTFSMITGVIDGVRKIKHLDKLVGLEKASSWLMGIGIGINVGLSIYDNLTNSNLAGAQKAGNILGDVGYIAASSAATYGISALTAMIPVVGPFLAPIVGFGFGTSFDQLWHGEDILGIDGFSLNPGGKSIDERIKAFFSELFGG